VNAFGEFDIAQRRSLLQFMQNFEIYGVHRHLILCFRELLIFYSEKDGSLEFI